MFNKVIGTGGIGKGLIFHSEINETLGRNESRLVNLSDAKDYCKQHIVLHYIARLCPEIDVLPIGAVGNDAYGLQLIKDMQCSGMDTRHVLVEDGHDTMLSICLQYPNKDGCNFSVSNSAMECVTPEYIKRCVESENIDSRTIAVALPEASIQSRFTLLYEAKKRAAFCVSSVAESEVTSFLQTELHEYCDLLAINQAEALAFAKAGSINYDTTKPNIKQITLSVYKMLSVRNSELKLMVTDGKYGGYSVKNSLVEHVCAVDVPVINTTGAGDACLGGTISGLINGLPLQSITGDDEHYTQGERCTNAVHLGMACSGLAISTKDSIVADISLQGLKLNNYMSTI